MSATPPRPRVFPMSREELTARQVQEVGEQLAPAFENSVRKVIDEKLAEIHDRLRAVENFQVRATAIVGVVLVVADGIWQLVLHAH